MLQPARKNIEFEVISAELKKLAGSVTIEGAFHDNRHSYILDVRVGPMGKGDTFMVGEVLVKTSLDGARELRIPVFAKWASRPPGKSPR